MTADNRTEPDEDEGFGWCLDCGDTFRYDDTGGYNPPCRCGMNCRSCCNSRCEEDGENEDDWSPADD